MKHVYRFGVRLFGSNNYFVTVFFCADTVIFDKLTNFLYFYIGDVVTGFVDCFDIESIRQFVDGDGSYSIPFDYSLADAPRTELILHI